MTETIYVQIDDLKRKATPEELAQIAKDTAEHLQNEETKATARQSALDKLAALGLTEDEIAAL
jgi:DNA-binding NarL/FixJ family response regulator